MRISLLIFFASLCIPSFAQDSINGKQLSRSTEFNLGVEYHTHFSNSCHATGITLGILQRLGRRFSVHAQTFLTPIIKLDPCKTRLVEHYMKNAVTTSPPSYSISSLTVAWSPFSTSTLSTGKNGEEQRNRSLELRAGYFYNLRNRSLELRAGYFYNQLTYSTFRPGIDYYQVDTASLGEPRYNFGFRSHALSIGVAFVSTKKTSKKTVVSRFHADLLQNIYFQYTSFKRQIDGTYTTYSSPDNGSNLQLAGMRFGYQYSHFRKGHWGGFYSLEAFWKPHLVHHAKSIYYPPRGSERLYPIAASVRVGVVYRL